MTVPVDLRVLEVQPHMHLFGREMKVTAMLPSGALVPLIWIKDYDFRRQEHYALAEPLFLPRGTQVWLEATYDNSAANPNQPRSPPGWVIFGERTIDEMCMCFIRVAVDRAEDLDAVALASLRARFRGPTPPPR